MSFQYASDLHLEFSQNKAFLKANPLIARADTLLLAGDIVPFAYLDKHQDFFNEISDKFETTYWVPGNHEYYHFDLSKKSGVLNENIRHNVHLVNNIAINQGDTRLLFSTLWSKINSAHQWQIERSMNDFQVIRFKDRRFSVEQFNRLHEESLDFITKELQQKTKPKTVVVTHHVPTYLHYPEKYKGDLLNEAFAVELFDLIERTEPDYWIFGHHHYNAPEFEIGKTKMRTNQLGYVQAREHGAFEQEKVLF